MKSLLSTALLVANIFCASFADGAEPLHLTLAITQRVFMGADKPKPDNISVVRRTSENNRVDDFYVVIANGPDRPRCIWAEWCDAGRKNLSFELTDENGNKTVASQPDLILAKGPVLAKWGLAPQEAHVFAVHLSEPLEWTGFPVFAHTDQVFTIRAIYEVKADESTEREGVWTGRLVSEPVRVRFVDRP